MAKRIQEAVAVFNAPGINLAGQAEKLRIKLSKLEGILGIEINYILDTVTVTYDSEKLVLTEIRRKLDFYRLIQGEKR